VPPPNPPPPPFTDFWIFVAWHQQQARAASCVLDLAKSLPIFLISSSTASTAADKIFVFLEARLDVKAPTRGVMRAPDWFARQRRIVGRH